MKEKEGEKQLNESLTSKFKEAKAKIKRREIIKNLAEKSLKKWMNDEEYAIHPCAFCTNAMSRAYNYYKEESKPEDGCRLCYVPKILCDGNNRKTVLYRMLLIKKRDIFNRRKYKTFYRIGEADKSGVYLMRTALQQLSKTGELANELIKEIKEYIKSEKKDFLKNL